MRVNSACASLRASCNAVWRWDARRDRVLDRVDSDLLGLLVLLQLGLATFPMLVLERPVKDGKDGYHDSQEKQRDEYEPIDTCHGYGSNARHLL